MNKDKKKIRPDGLPKDLGKAFKRARARRGGLTQEDVAREMGVSVYAVRAWETNKVRPMKGMFLRAVQAFLASPDAPEDTDKGSEG